MLAQLRSGRSIELSKTGRNICCPDDFKGSLEGLYRRGFVNTKKVMLNGKEIIHVYITQAGKTFLDKENSKKLGGVYNII